MRSIRHAISTGAACSALLAAAAPEYIWTGAVDAYWTNAANWQVDGQPARVVPGQYFLPNDAAATNRDAIAVFGVSGAERTTVDLAGLHFVSGLVVRAGAPAYTFGSRAGQYLGLASAGGFFRVEAGAKAPTVKGVYGLIYEPGMSSSGPDAYDAPDKEARFVNDSDETLVLENFGNRAPGVPDGKNTIGYFRPIGLGGSGNIKISSWVKNESVLALNLYPENGARLMVMGTSHDRLNEGLIRNIQIGGGRQGVIEIYEKEFECYSGIEAKISDTATRKMPPIVVRDAGTRLTFTGAGSFALRGAAKEGTSWGSGFLRAAADVETGAELVFDCAVAPFKSLRYGTPADPREGFYLRNGGGTVRFAGANTSSGGIDLLSTSVAGATLTFDSLSGFGTGPVRLGQGACLAYTGAEALAFAQPLVLTNGSINLHYAGAAAIPPTATVDVRGTGALTVASTLDVSGTGTDAVLTLANATATPAVWTGLLADAADGSVLSVVKTGAGTWTLSGANTHSGATTVSGGTLAIAAGGSIANSPVVINDGATLALAAGQTIADLTFNGTAHLALAAGETFEAAKLMQGSAGARLLVTLGDGARLRCPGLTELPDWLTVASPRGRPVPSQLDSDGYLTARVTRWQGADGASWAEAANWSDGVPATDRLAVVDAAGAAVAVPSSATTETAGAVWLEAGTLNVQGALAVQTPKDGERFLVRTGATVRVSGGTLALASADGVSGPALELDGGAVAVEAGVLDVSNSRGVVGAGELSVAAGAQLAVMQGGASTGFGTGEATGELALTLKPGCLYGKSAGHVVFGAAQQGKTSLTVEAPDSGDPLTNVFVVSSPSPRSIKIGREHGTTEATLAGGNLQPGNWGVQIAQGDSAGAAVTGRVHLAGGKITAASGYLDGSWSGLAVGISTAAVPDPRSVRGEVWLEAGEVSIYQVSPLGLGVGGAEGFVRQTGGKLGLTSVAGAMVLGYGSGTGEYVLSNGTVATSRPLYVGGCLRADLELKKKTNGDTIPYSEGGNHPAGRQVATGAFYAHGGELTVTAEKGIRVGVDGVGRFEVGAGAAVTTTELVLSNACASTLAFTLGADGAAGSLTAAKLVIADGARLEIDATRLASAARSTFRLAHCGEVAGAFAPENVTVHAPAGQEARFAEARVVTARAGQAGLWLKVPGPGMVLILR